jgi:hypothetical protein
MMTNTGFVTLTLETQSQNKRNNGIHPSARSSALARCICILLALGDAFRSTIRIEAITLVNSTLSIKLFILIPFSFAGCTDTAPNSHMNEKALGPVEIKWPSLPHAGFVAGRVANQKDVDDGNAAFAAFGGVKSDLSNTVVPQYALFTDDNGNPVRVIVIQAEIVHSEKGDIEAFGLRSIDSGDLILGVSESVSLLGTTNPGTID